MIRQPASENSFTVACPMPREAPVNTMVFCSADGCALCESAPGNGHSTVFSKADLYSDRRAGSTRVSMIISAPRAFAARSVGDISTHEGLHDPGQAGEIRFRRAKLPDWMSCELILGTEASECRFTDTSRYVRYKVRRRQNAPTIADVRTRIGPVPALPSNETFRLNTH